MDAIEKLTADGFFHYCAVGVVEEGDMVAIPTDSATYVEEESGNKLKKRGNFVRQIFCRMEVAGIQAVSELFFYGIAEIKFV